MDDKKKTKAQLIAELDELRKRTAEIETAEAERKKAEEIIKRKNLELNTFINSIPDMAWFNDINSNFIIVNQAFGKAVGMDTEYLVNNTCEICFGKEIAKSN